MVVGKPVYDFLFAIIMVALCNRAESALLHRATIIFLPCGFFFFLLLSFFLA